jgi:hypothetical protein
MNQPSDLANLRYRLAEILPYRRKGRRVTAHSFDVNDLDIPIFRPDLEMEIRRDLNTLDGIVGIVARGFIGFF